MHCKRGIDIDQDLNTCTVYIPSFNKSQLSKPKEPNPRPGQDFVLRHVYDATATEDFSSKLCLYILCFCKVEVL